MSAPHRGTPYRLANEVATPAARSEGLEELLRGRLRILTLLAAITAVPFGVATLVSNWTRIRRDPWAAITIPPFALPMLGMAALMLTIWWVLRPGRPLVLRRLRVAEWLTISAWATFFVIVVAGDLRVVLADVARLPIDLAMAHASMWGLLLVIWGVLLPSTPRVATLRNAALVGCTFLPDLVILASTAQRPEHLAVYLGAKTAMVLCYAATATYGGYRIEALRRDAQDARQMGQYVLTSPLGAGGMGEVYLAEHRLLRRPCAVKLIRPDQAGDAATLRRFEREAQATATLSHPSTVQVYDFGIADDGTFYYVMEYLHGETLDELLRREGPQSPGRTIMILRALCGALQEAHDRGLVHRDLKPGNVMLCELGGVRDMVKLLDFGLVAAVRDTTAGPPSDATGTEATLAGTVVGTPAYMSPEQVGGDTEVGPPSDLYSLGALAHALLTGGPPFADRNPMQMMVAHLREVPPRVDMLRPDVPSSLADVVARCLAKAPTERFPDARSLDEVLAVCDPAPVAAREVRTVP